MSSAPLDAKRVWYRSAAPIVVVTTATFLGAVALAVYMTRPLAAGTLGYDAAASVLYFDRMVAGRQLEAFLGATPKPLLTLIYGMAHAIVPDWRVISLLAIAAYGAGIAATTALAYRLAGATASVFVAVGLLGSAELLQDVDLAYAVTWATVCWAIAGLLVTQSRPRYAWAGVALAIGGLARLETMIIVVAAGILLAMAYVRNRRTPAAGAAFRTRAPILLGLAALPVQLVHDVILTGDPTYSFAVPVIGSIGLDLPGVQGLIGQLGKHFASEPAAILLGFVGTWSLVRLRQWAIVCGIISLSFGVLLFLVYLAYRGVYVSNRYVAPVDIALTFGAGVGAASLFTSAAAVAPRPRSGRQAVARGAFGAVLALALIRPLGPMDPATRTAIAVNGRVHRDLVRVTPVLASAIRGRGVPSWPSTGSPTTPMGSAAVLLVPILTVPQLAVDLGLSLSAISGTRGQSISTDGSYPRPGQILFHHVDRDQPPAAFAAFEVATATAVGDIAVNPILVDPQHRFWIVKIDRQ